MATLTSDQGTLIISVPAGSSLRVYSKSGTPTVSGSSVSVEDVTTTLGCYVYGPQTSNSTITITTTGVLVYDIVAGDPTPAVGEAYSPRFSGYAGLRAYDGLAAYATVTGAGVCGHFYLDASDTTSTDNGGTVIVDSSGRRWKRQIDGAAVRVEWFGAKGDWNGTTGTDSTDAIKRAASFVRQFSSSTVAVASGVASGLFYLSVGAGNFLITESGALLPSTFSTVTLGYVLRGAGKALTNVIFQPAVAGTLIQSNSGYLVNHVEGLTFYSNNADNKFTESVSNGNGGSQNWAFVDCAWSGKWTKGFDLTGSNNNSEFSWTRCEVNGLMEDFLYVGATGTSDQFLNYWFDKFKFWPTSTERTNCWINLSKGGHVKIHDSDVSGYQNGTLFKLYGTSHSQGVCNFVTEGLRGEFKSSNTKLIYCTWPQGVVSFNNFDASSQATVYDKTVTFAEFAVSNMQGAKVAFRNSDLIGKIRFTHNSEDWRNAAIATFDTCRHVQYRDFTDCFDIATSTNNGGEQPVRLTNCTGSGTSLNNFTSWAASTAYTVGTLRVNGKSLYECTTAGTSASSGGPTGKGTTIADGTCVWKWAGNDTRDYATGDGNIGRGRSRNALAQRRVVYLTNGGGVLPNSGDSSECILPPNAIVVGARIYAAAGAASTGNYPTFVLKNQATSVSTLIDMSAVVTAASAGFDYKYTGTPIKLGTDVGERTFVLVGATNQAIGGNSFCELEYVA